MRKSDAFRISRKLYAVNLTSLTTQQYTGPSGHPYYAGRIGAVWFRRKNGRLTAYIGALWDYQDGLATTDPIEFLTRHDDGRHGGDCDGRWDGTSYWGPGTLADQHRHLAVLQPMLENFPAIPPGYDGWWSFR